MRYAICFTPSPSEPLTYAAASWLGRDIYTGCEQEPPDNIKMSLQEHAFYTAIPRRFGFHAKLMAPFQLTSEMSEAALLRELMCFASAIHPITLPKFEVGRLGSHFGLYLSEHCEVIQNLAAEIVHTFSRFADRSEQIRARTSLMDELSATQLTNLMRWGDPFAMEEFRFQMALTGPINQAQTEQVDCAIRTVFEPILRDELTVANIALLAEDGNGGPFRVHSLHPLGPVKAHAKKGKQSKFRLAA